MGVPHNIPDLKGLTRHQVAELVTYKPWRQRRKTHHKLVEDIFTQLFTMGSAESLYTCRHIFGTLWSQNYRFGLRSWVASGIKRLDKIFTPNTYARWLGRVFGAEPLKPTALIKAIDDTRTPAERWNLIKGIQEGHVHGHTPSTTLAFFLVSRAELEWLDPKADKIFSYGLQVSTQSPHFFVTYGCRMQTSPESIANFWLRGSTEDRKHRAETMIPMLLGDLSTIRDDSTMDSHIRHAAQIQLSAVFKLMSENGIFIGPPRSQQEMEERNTNWNWRWYFRKRQPDGFSNITNPYWRVF